MKKLPEDAFAIYLALGASRSHQAVADRFGVDKKTVTNRAIKENWKDRVAEHERKQREEAEKKAKESLSAMDDRQLRVAGYIQAKAIEALRSMPLDSAMDAVKAYKLAVEMERMIRGSPNQKQSVIDIEKKIREEHKSWLVPVAEDATDNAPAGGPPPSIQPPAVEMPSVNENTGDEQPKAGGSDGEIPPEGGPQAEEPGAAT